MPTIPYLDAITAHPIFALIAGLLLLLVPRLMVLVAAVFLIVIGCMEMWPHLVSQNL